MTRAVIYARYSSSMQSPGTIDVQLDSCRRYGDAQGYDLSTEPYIDEAKTGTTESGREAYARLMADGRAGRYDIALVYRFDRLGRSFMETVRSIYELEKVHERRVESATEPNTPLTRNIMLSVAEDFSRQLGERIHDSFSRHVSVSGRHVWRPCYGYVKEPKSGVLTVDSETAEIVRLIFDLRLQGNGARKISRELERRSIPPPAGKSWTSTAVRRILERRMYAGDLVWNRQRPKRSSKGKKMHVLRPEDEWIVVEGTHEAIISRDMWRRAQELLLAVPGRPAGVLNGKYLLTGMMTCGVCGHPYHMKPWSGGRRWRYHCGHRLRHGVEACSNALSLLKDGVEEWAMEVLKDLNTPENRRRASREARRAIEQRRGSGEAQKLQKELGDAQRRVDRYVKAIGEGVALSSVKDALERAERERAAIETRIFDVEMLRTESLPTAAQMVTAATATQAALSGGDIPAIRSALAETVGSIVVNPDGVVLISRQLDPDASTWEYVYTP